MITNLEPTDVLPGELQFLSVVSTTPSSAAAISTPSTTTPGGILTRRFASVAGTSGAIDAQMTFSFYVPRINATPAAIIDPATGGEQIDPVINPQLLPPVTPSVLGPLRPAFPNRDSNLWVQGLNIGLEWRY